jgi:hypothetical protein
MSARTEDLPVRVNERPWMPWVVATIALAVIAAGLGSYLMLRSSVERSPAVTRTVPAPAVVTPVIPQQPVATPAGPRIPELAGTEVPTAGGAGSTSHHPVRQGSRDGPGSSEPDCAGSIRGGPC